MRRDEVVAAHDRAAQFHQRVDPARVFQLVEKVERDAAPVSTPRFDGTRRARGYKSSSGTTLADDSAVREAHLLRESIIRGIAGAEANAHAAAAAFDALVKLAADRPKEAITEWFCPGFRCPPHMTELRRVNGMCKRCADRRYGVEHRAERAASRRRRKAETIAA